MIEQQEPERNRVTAQVRELQQTVNIEEHDHDYYALLGKKSLRLQNRVADIVRFVQFDRNYSAAKSNHMRLAQNSSF